MSSFKKDFGGLARQRDDNPTLFYVGSIHIKESQVFAGFAFGLLFVIGALYAITDWGKIQTSWNMLF